MNPESIAENMYAESSLSWSVEVNGRHSSPYNSMDSTADRQRPILIASFALELKIEWSLVVAAHALDKRDQKTVSAFEVGAPRFKFVTAIYGIAIHEADVSDGGLPEVHRLGFVVVDC